VRSKRQRTADTATEGDATAAGVEPGSAEPAPRSSVDDCVRVEAVGRVTHLVQFKGMADFQHTRAAEDPEVGMYRFNAGS
jgi:hypothetical protein